MNSSPLPALDARRSTLDAAASPALDARLTAPAASGLCRTPGATFGSLPRPSPRAWFSTLDPAASPALDARRSTLDPAASPAHAPRRSSLDARPSPPPALDPRRSTFDSATSSALDARLTAPAASGLCRPPGATFGSLPRPSPRAWFSTLDPAASPAHAPRRSSLDARPSPLPALDARRSTLDPAASPALDPRRSTLDPAASAAAAFSLIEVVLAIGVVAFALVGIFGLFTSSLKNNKDSSAQQEGFEVARLISSRLQDTNFLTTTAMSNLVGPLYISFKSTNYYVYTSNNSLVLNSNPPNNSLTNGLLYYVQLNASSNMASATNIFPRPAGMVTVPTLWTNWPGLPVRVRVYTIPGPTQTNVITNTPPVMIFDMVIPR